ncbi:MAG: DUF4340 domain-containing protein [Bacteroidota bacterium]
MQTIRNLFILFILLGAGALYYLSEPAEEQQSSLGADRNFAVENVEDIGKIFIADRKGNRTLLERKGEQWIFNDTYPAKPNAVDNLLDAVRRVQVKFKPPQAAEEHIVKSLASEGIKVEIYDRSGTLIKAYYVGGATSDERGTYMILENANQPYVAHIPSWEGNIRFRYNLKDDAWRDETILAYTPEEIESISIEYPKQRNKSFILERDGNDFTVRPFFELTPKINRPLSQGLIEGYLMNYEAIMAEGFENKNPGKDSIRAQVPFSIITVNDTKGKSKTIKLFPIYIDRSGVDPKTGLVVNTEFPVERYFIDASNGDFFLTQHRLLSKLLWAYEFFYEQPS